MPQRKRKKAKNSSVGRPSKKKTISLKQVQKLAEVGLVEDQIAAILFISRETLSQYKDPKSQYYWPQFSDALKVGKAKSDSCIEESLYNRALGYSHPEEKIFTTKTGRVIRVDTIKHYPPDPTSCIFWLKNRRKDLWRDKMDHEHGFDDGTKKVLSAALNKLSKGKDVKE